MFMNIPSPYCLCDHFNFNGNNIPFSYWDLSLLKYLYFFSVVPKDG